MTGIVEELERLAEDARALAWLGIDVDPVDCLLLAARVVRRKSPCLCRIDHAATLPGAIDRAGGEAG